MSERASVAEHLALYAHLRVFESDFDKAQGQLRAISSAWSAAVLAATALIVINVFTMTERVPPAPAEKAEMLLLIGQVVLWVGSLGVFALWFVDQRIYQRLLHSVFAYGLHLELKNPAGPQVRSGLWAANLDVTHGLGNYYLAQFLVFLVLSICLVLLLGIDAAHIRNLAILGLHVASALYLYQVTRQWPSLHELIDRLYPDLAAALPKQLADDTDPKALAWKARLRGPP